MWRAEGGVASVLTRPNLFWGLGDWEERGKEDDENAKAAGIVAIAVVAIDLRNAILLQLLLYSPTEKRKCAKARGCLASYLYVSF